MAMEFTSENFAKEVLRSDVPVLVNFGKLVACRVKCWHQLLKNWQKRQMKTVQSRKNRCRRRTFSCSTIRYYKYPYCTGV